MSSHSELRCPECRILVDIKIDELPPNVLLMRILGGMKNATVADVISPLQVHNRNKQSQQASAASAGTLIISNLNGITSEHGVGGVNAYIRDQVKRAANAAAALSSESGGHRTEQRASGGGGGGGGTTVGVVGTVAAVATTNAITTIKSNGDGTPNGLRSLNHAMPHQARQPLQALPPIVNSNNSQPSNATSPSIPHAKALYDFESKEPG